MNSLKKILDSFSSAEDIADFMIFYEMKKRGISEDEIISSMRRSLEVMKRSIDDGLNERFVKKGYLVRGNSAKVLERIRKGKAISGNILSKMIAYSLAVAETNGSMGRIVACPTAGASGIVPGTLIAFAEEKDINEDKIIKALIASSAIGIVVAKRATIAGAEGGCQAECGTAAAMAASGLVYLMQGTAEDFSNAASLALKNSLGLVCDPVAGLVQVPCIKRNAVMTANALSSAEMALSGIGSEIPFDEIVDAMKEIGSRMPQEYRETSKGGLAMTKTGRKIAEDLCNK